MPPCWPETSSESISSLLQTFRGAVTVNVGPATADAVDCVAGTKPHKHGAAARHPGIARYLPRFTAPASTIFAAEGPPTQSTATTLRLAVGRRADWTPIGALTSCFLLTHRGQHRALNNTDRRGNPLIWLDCGGQQSVLDNKPGCTRWRARSGSRHGRRERDLAGGVGAARPVSIAVSMTFPMRSAAASTSRSLTWA